jgi:hypothetical protein
MARVPCFLLMSFAICSPVAAKTACPPHKAGEPYPWEVSGLVEGDHWADIAVDLDAKGHVTGCRIAKGNLESDEGFYMCRAMTSQGEFDPVVKDGVAIAGTITAHSVLQGMKHRDLNASARKRWFAAHPEERQSCYPD